MPTENSVITREHLPGLLLARTIWENGGPSLHFPPALQDATDQARAALPAPASVPDGYMPIPTAEQIADALENVRCFHDLGAELIAPRLLANLLAAPTVKAEQAPTPEFVWVRLLEALAGDNGCPFTASTDDYREAKPALVQLIAAGLFRDDADSLDGDIWTIAAGEQSEAAARFASCADAYAVLSDVLNRVFERPDEAPSLPAAGSAEEEVEVVAWRYRHSEQEKWQAGVERKSLWETEPLMTVAQHERIVAALSAQQSAHVSVPRELLDAVKELFDAKQAKEDFERENPGNSTKRWDACLYRIDAAEDALRALLNGGEA